jgi:hypothetical protein
MWVAVSPEESLRLGVHDPADIDDEVVAWLREAANHGS